MNIAQLINYPKKERVTVNSFHWSIKLGLGEFIWHSS